MAATSGIFELPLKATTPLPAGCRIYIGDPTDTTQAPQGSLKWMLVADFLINVSMQNVTIRDLTVGPSGLGNFIVTTPSVFLSALPTSASGLTSGQVWRNGSVLNIVP